MYRGDIVEEGNQRCPGLLKERGQGLSEELEAANHLGSDQQKQEQQNAQQNDKGQDDADRPAAADDPGPGTAREISLFQKAKGYVQHKSQHTA